MNAVTNQGRLQVGENRLFPLIVFAALTCVGWILPAQGQTNQLLRFGGGGGFATIASAPDLQNPDAFTMEAWIYPEPTGASSEGFISKSDGRIVSSSRSYELRWCENGGNTGSGNRVEVDLFIGTTNWALLGAPAPEGQWVHVAATYRSSDGLHQLFTNGVLAASSTTDEDKVTSLAGKTLRQTSLPLYFGELNDGLELNLAKGDIDEISIWSTVLTPTQIRQTMHCRLNGSEPDLAAYWNFDGGQVTDLSGHDHDGTLSGDAAIVPMVGQDVIHANCGLPTFLGVRMVGDGLPLLTFEGQTGVTYAVEVSSNLVDWSPWVALPDRDGYLEVIDPDATNHARRFYRALKQ